MEFPYRTIAILCHPDALLPFAESANLEKCGAALWRISHRSNGNAVMAVQEAGKLFSSSIYSVVIPDRALREQREGKGIQVVTASAIEKALVLQ